MAGFQARTICDMVGNERGEAQVPNIAEFKSPFAARGKLSLSSLWSMFLGAIVILVVFAMAQGAVAWVRRQPAVQGAAQAPVAAGRRLFGIKGA